VPAGDRGDAWPRHAVALSLLVAAAGFVVALAGIGLGADDPTLQYAAVAAAFASQVGAAWLLRSFFDRWFEGRLDERGQERVVRAMVVAAGVMVVLAVLPPTRPVGVAAIGGMIVGLMLANVAAVLRARRGR
jgi:hypothetical protein